MSSTRSISTFDALNYLSPPEFGATVAAVARRLRPGGWLVFDLHTDAMLDFTWRTRSSRARRTGGSSRSAASWTSAPGPATPASWSVGAADGDAFAEQHRQYFHTAAQVLDALMDAGFALTAETDEYTHKPADASTLRATWTARYLAA